MSQKQCGIILTFLDEPFEAFTTIFKKVLGKQL
jgi:hypothetical protein